MLRCAVSTAAFSLTQRINLSTSALVAHVLRTLSLSIKMNAAMLLSTEITQLTRSSRGHGETMHGCDRPHQTLAVVRLLMWILTLAMRMHSEHCSDRIPPLLS